MFINDKNNDGPLSPVSSNLPRVYTGNVYSNKQLAAQKLPFCLILTDKTLQNNYHKPTTTLNTFSDSFTNSVVFGWGNGKQGWSLIRAKQKFIAEQPGTWDLRIGLCQLQSQLQSQLGRILKCGKSDYNWSVISAVMETNMTAPFVSQHPIAVFVCFLTSFYTMELSIKHNG